MDSILLFKAAANGKRRQGIGYEIAHALQVEGAHTNRLQANEYLDFMEFLEGELGVDEFRRLRRKFEIQEFGEALTYDENLETIEE